MDAVTVFPKTNVNISNDDIRIIKHSRKSLLFHNTEAWKKISESCFDVTMGSHDGPEVCELIGIFILSHLTKLIDQNDIGLYGVDGLVVVKNLNGEQTDKPGKRIIHVFKNFGFKIEIKTNLFEVLFLDVTFSLITETFKQCKKLNNNLRYINVFSNHPPILIKRLPNLINDLLSRNSSSKEILDNTKEDYQKALDKSGYKSKLLYNNNINSKENNSIKKTSNKEGERKTIWFNPPYNKYVVTNVAKIFLKLLNKHFPKNNKLHKIFNPISVKVIVAQKIATIRTNSNQLKIKNFRVIVGKKKTVRCKGNAE